MISRRASLLVAGVIAVGFTGLLQEPARAAAETLRDQIVSLGDAHGFEVKGLEKLESTPSRAVTGGPRDRLKALLGNYDHVVLGAPPSVERVIILGIKQKQPAQFVVTTTRHGAHHMVEANLEGDNGQLSTLSLMVDTGASTVVLPMSMIEELGFDEGTLPDTRTRTASGSVPAKAAHLSRVQLGSAVATDVKVLFLPDARLGQTRLLGMSFLENFTLTIDDQSNRLLLKPR